MKKVLAGIIVILLSFALTIFIIGRVFYPDNVAATSEDGGQKRLKTRIYQTDLQTAHKTVKDVIPTLKSLGSSWKVVDDVVNNDSASVKAEIPVVVFTDDLEVKMKTVGINGGIQLDVVSKSRVGQSDFGENARSVRKLLSALDERLAKQ